MGNDFEHMATTAEGLRQEREYCMLKQIRLLRKLFVDAVGAGNNATGQDVKDWGSKEMAEHYQREKRHVDSEISIYGNYKI